MKNEHITEVKFEKEWIEALDKAFKNVSKSIEIDGFRKGSVPKEMFIKKYGVESLYEEAINIVLKDNDKSLAGDDSLELVIRPIVDVKDVTPKSITITVKRITEPVAELGEYKNLDIKKEVVKVTKKDIDNKINELVSEHADFVVEDKEIETGDMAVIDFSGIVDGEILEGGTGFDYELEIGSNSFIPGFEEKLIGLKTGEEKVLNLKFPEEYHEGLKGKDVEFTVTIKEVKSKKLPELNAEFFEDLGLEDINNENSFRKSVEENLQIEKTEESDKKAMDEIFEKGIKNMKLEINSEIVHEEIEHMLMEIEDSLKPQGIDLETYMKMIGMDEKSLEESMQKTAKSRLEVKYFLKAVAVKESIKAEKNEVEEKVKEFCEHTGNDEKESKANKGLINYMENIVILEKASKFLKENN